MKRFKSILNHVLTAVLVLTLVFAGYVLVTVLRTEKGRVPSVFGYSFMKVATGSMEPTIPTGSVIIVRKAEPASIGVGDVITFYSSDPSIQGMPNTHRVVGVTQENGQFVFTTKGDAIDAEDPYPVVADQLVGVYLRSVAIGKLVEVIHSPYFFFFALLIPLCAVVFYELVHFRKLAEEREAKRHADSE